jgi:hypothetical protein
VDEVWSDRERSTKICSMLSRIGEAVACSATRFVFASRLCRLATRPGAGRCSLPNKSQAASHTLLTETVGIHELHADTSRKPCRASGKQGCIEARLGPFRATLVQSGTLPCIGASISWTRRLRSLRDSLRTKIPRQPSQRLAKQKARSRTRDRRREIDPERVKGRQEQELTRRTFSI